MNGLVLELNLTQSVAASSPSAESIHTDGLSLFPAFKPDLHARSRFSKKRDKVCSKCNQLLPINQFKKREGRHAGRFRVCHACFDDLQHKVCPRCQQRLHFSQFNEAPSGRSSVCAACSKTRLPNEPNPAVRCALCLYAVGFGCRRISLQLYGTYQQRRRVIKWIRGHVDERDPNRGFKEWVAHLRKNRKTPAYRYTPRPPKPASLLHYERSIFRLKKYLRSKLWMFLKHGLHPKSIARLIGCDRDQFVAHLRPMLQPGMSFDNYGPVWHLDHVIPCKLFNLRDPDQRRLCFHYTNIQPMFADANRHKAATLPPFDALANHLATLNALSLSAQAEFPFAKSTSLTTPPIHTEGTLNQ